MRFIVDGLSFPVWLPPVVVLALVVGVWWLLHRRQQGALGRELTRTMRGVANFKGSIHPDGERLP